MTYELTEVRNAVFAWASRHGVLADTVSAAAEIAEGDPSILPFTAEHADYFRTRKIVRVYGDVGRSYNELKIFARLKVAQTKIAELKHLFDKAFAESRIRLSVDISKPFKVDQAVQSYGRFDPIRRIDGRITCGSSVGIGNQRNAGTLTALVRYRKDDESLYGISCNHVVGGCSTARPGTPVVVPGIQDVSADHDEITVIGVHFSAAPMSQGLPSVFNISPNRDLACFRLTDPDLLTSTQGNDDYSYDTPPRYARTPKVGTAVKKWGRSTRLTYGRISHILRGGEPIPYNVTSYYGPMNSQVFKGTVYYDEIYEVDPASGPGSQGGPFSLGGDSGALVVTHGGGPTLIVGIVVAGGREKSLVLPLKPAMEVLDLEIVTGHNVSA